MKRLLQIALLLAGLGWCVPAHAATWAVANHTTGCLNSASPCALTVPSTTAGNLLLGTATYSGTGHTLTSITGGTSVTNAACNGSGGSSSTSMAYVLSATGGTTTVTFTGGGTFESVDLIEYSNANGAAFDVCANRTQAVGGGNIAGVSAGTLSGTNDAIVQWIRGSGTTTGCPNSAASPADFLNGNGVGCGLINSTNNAAGNWANGSMTAAMSAIAFKEAAAGATACTAGYKALKGVGCL